jgi:predicted NUDIX family NTP pyrophosphohydrolase
MKQFNVGIKGVVRRQDGAVLLLRKNQDDAFWDVPGGRIDGDESIEQTLNRELAEELPNSGKDELLEFLVETKLAESKSSARRLVEQGSIQINGQKANLDTKFSTESLVKKGKNSFAVKL